MVLSCCLPFCSDSCRPFFTERHVSFYLKVTAVASIGLISLGMALSWNQTLNLPHSLCERLFFVGQSSLGITVVGGFVLLTYKLCKKRPKIPFESLERVMSGLQNRVQPVIFHKIKTILNLSDEYWGYYIDELDYSFSIISKEVKGTHMQSNWEGFLETLKVCGNEYIKESCAAQTEILKGNIHVFQVLAHQVTALPIDLTVLELLEKETHVDKSVINQLRAWFSKTPVVFKSHLDLHALHYCLTKITDEVLLHEEKRLKWKAFLLSIHQKVHFTAPSGELALFDCSIELEKIDGKIVAIEAIEQVKDLTQNELSEIYDICKISFTEFYRTNTDAKLKDRLFQEGNQCFVFRDHSRRILGIVETRESLETSWFQPPKKKLFFHTLARRPDAKINMVDAFFKYIVKKTEDEKIIECHVLKNNYVAIARYQNNGMTIQKRFENHYLMRYESANPVLFSDKAFYLFRNLLP